VAVVDPFLVHRFVFAWPDKVFHLHLFKLPRTKDEVPRGHFVAKRFADLRNAKRKFPPAGRQDIEKVNKDSLRRFWSQINER
jgi:hypothetical protein